MPKCYASRGLGHIAGIFFKTGSSHVGSSLIVKHLLFVIFLAIGIFWPVSTSMKMLKGKVTRQRMEKRIIKSLGQSLNKGKKLCVK